MARNLEKLEQQIQLQKYPAQYKKYEESILFVHFFDGSPKLIRPHIKLVNQLGYDAYAYQVDFHVEKRSLKQLLSPQYRLGLKRFWTQDVEDCLNAIPGKKIIFAFSNPASAAIEAIARRSLDLDVEAMICDSGPFHQMITCSYNLLHHYFGLKSKLLLVPASLATALVLSPLHESLMDKDLEKFPKDFPILSIRGWKDPLVPPAAIEKVFAKHQHLNLQVLNLTEAKHLNGLKDFREMYSDRVESFLKSVTMPLSANEAATAPVEMT